MAEGRRETPSLTPTRYRESGKKLPSQNIPIEVEPKMKDESTEAASSSAASTDEQPPRQSRDQPMVELQDTRTSSLARGEPSTFERNRRSSNLQEDLRPHDQGPKANGRCAFWYTSEMYKGKDREKFIQLSIQEFIMFLIFLLSVSIVAFGSFTTIMYYYSTVLSNIFTKTRFETPQHFNSTTRGLPLTYREVRTAQQFWADKLTMMTLTMEESKLILLENIMIGVPRLRQVRVKPDSCKVPQYFSDIFRSCYGYYNRLTEDREPFGLKYGSEWTYNEDIAMEHTGKISTYGTGGYYLNLTRNYEFSQSLISTLRQNLWIDHGTRAVFIDFTVYSPNVNLFCVVKLVAEFPPSGGVIPTSSFHTLNLIRYVSVWDHVILAFEIVSLVMLILYTIEEIREIIVFQWDYVWIPWNIVDIVIVILGWNVATLGFLRYSIISQQMPDLIKTINTDDHGNFDSLSDIQKLFNTTIAFFVTLVWLKLIKYMMLIKVMYHLLKTIGKCVYELLGLTFILLVLLLSFAILGNLLFGSQVEAFGTIAHSFTSLTILIVGGLDYKEVQEARPFLGPLYFMLFFFFFILMFLCLFVAVIVNGFTMVRFDILEDRKNIYLKNILYNLLVNILNGIRFKGLATRLKEKLRRDKANENYYVIKDILRRSGFRGEEMNLFLKKHKIEQGKEISKHTMEQIYEEIDSKGLVFTEAVEHEQILNEFDMMKLKIAYSDKLLEELSSKVTLLLSKVK